MIPFTQAAFEAFCTAHRVTPKTRAYIDASFEAPARRVLPGKKNSKSTIPCPKMGFVLAMESNPERACILDHLFDDDVIGYLEQPHSKLHLAYRREDGKRIRAVSTVDCMVFDRNEGLILEEVKPWEKLLALSEEDPVRYRRLGSRIVSPPAEEAASIYGAQFRFVTERSVPAVRSQNHQTLFDYAETRGCPSGAQLDQLARAFNGRECLNGHELESIDRNILLGAVTHGHLFVDFDQVRLAKLNRVMFYRTVKARDALVVIHRAAAFSRFDQDLNNAIPGDRLDLDGTLLTITLVTDTQVFAADDGMAALTFERSTVNAQLEAGKACLIDGTRSLSEPLASASLEDMREAQRRLLMVNGSDIPAHLGPAPQVTRRTLSTWRTASRQAIAALKDPLIALLPKRYARGNRVSRLAPDEREFLQDHIATIYLQDNARSIKGAHADYKPKAVAAGMDEISLETYRRAVKKLDAEAVALARDGEKSAQNAAAFDEFLELSSDRHGRYPMDRVHIDHTILDVHVLSSQTGEQVETKRPTLTLAIDSFSRAIVGMFISLEKPSREHVLCCICDIVRRRKRLPTTIAVDGGSEFYSTDFESTMAFYGTCIRSREGKPRSGNVIERAFGITNDQFLHELVGNTKLSKIVRLLTPTVDPQNLACIPLVELMEGLEEYWFEIFNKKWKKLCHFMTPEAAFRKGVRELGSRSHRRILFDKDFLIRVLPTIKGNSSRGVDPQRGFTCLHDDYNHPIFYSSRGNLRVEQIKINPWNPSVVFAWFQGQWIECVCRNRRDLVGDDFDQRRAFFEERPALIADVLEAQNDASVDIAEVVERLNVHRDRPVATLRDGAGSYQASVPVVVADDQSAVRRRTEKTDPPRFKTSSTATSSLPALSDKSWREAYR